MPYSILPPPLHQTADAARAFFRNYFGTPSFRIEESPYQGATYRPTFSGVTRDHHILCVDVSDTPYTNSLDAFVLDCKQRALPVKLFVAIPKGDGDSNFKANLRRAKENGVGVVEVGDGSGSVIHDALSLLLTGVRPYNAQDFPAKYREAVSGAYNTFLNGDPAKGCARIFDELEALCRVIGRKALRRRCFGNMAKATTFNFDTGPWATLIQFLNKHLDRGKAKCPGLNEALFARIHGTTPHRNDSGHKPGRDTTALTRRDRELRTRFEHAADLLRDVIEASRGLSP